MEASIRNALVHFAVMAVLGLLAGAALRGVPARDATTGFRRLTYPRSTRLFGRVLLFLMTAAFVGVLLTGPGSARGAPIWFCALVFGFVVLSLLCVIEFERVIVSWTEYEIEARTPWTGDKRMTWTDVESLVYSPAMQWFVLTSRSGAVIRVHYMLGGFAAFLADARTRLDPAVYGHAEEAMKRALRR